MMQPGTPAAQTTGAWQRILKRRPPLTGERCEMCAEEIDERHAHVVNVDQRALMCVCRACYLLFTGEGAARGHYRAVPDAYERVEPIVMSEAQWAELGIPVSPAFFFHNSQLGRAAAFYPSPAGATESLLPLDAWEAIVAANPALQRLAPDVEGVLIRRQPAGFECYRLPIDRCYELVGLLRLHWRGFDGGDDVHAAIAAFFVDVASRCAVASGGDA
jgi:hypothetical protein